MYRCKICGEVPKEGEATYHLHTKHRAAYARMDYVTDYMIPLTNRENKSKEEP
jgi:hypothetical protein